MSDASRSAPHAIIAPQKFIHLEAQLRSARVAFTVEPVTQHVGTRRERRKMIFTDPSGNAIEIKSYADPSNIFA